MPDLRDVRMRGFHARAAVDDVLALLHGLAAPLPAERIPLADAADRILAADLHAPLDVPAFARAAVDGYAVRGEDTFAATDQAPLPLRLRGESLPGRPCPVPVGEGDAVRITTGAPLPAGADAVLQAELARLADDGRDVLALGPVAPLRHIGQVGEDLARGALVLRAGRRLRPQDVGVLASLGLAAVPVVRRPRLAYLSTGDELVAPGAPPGPFQIVDSNALTVAALADRDRAERLPPGRSRDGAAPLRAALQDMVHGPADVLVVSGATSVGTMDLMPLLVRELGELLVHGVAMRPSSPAGLGRLADGRPIFLLPGNPVSCLCAYEFFVGPLLRALGGRPRPWEWPHPRRRLPLARKITSALGRTDFVRVTLVGPADAPRVEPVATSGASLLSTLVAADGVVIVPPEREGHAAGDLVEVRLFDDPGAPL